jgi:hypothetical protein
MILPIGARGIITPGLGFIHPYPASGPFGGHATLGDGLLAYLKMQNNITDEKGSLSASLVNSPSYVDAKIGKGIDFERNKSQYINLASDRITTSTKGTIAFWVKFETVNDNSLFGYGGNNTTNPGTFDLSILTAVSGKLRFAQASDGNATLNDIRGSSTLSASTWYHIAFMSTDTAYKMFVNAVAETLTVSAGSNDGKWIGDTTINAGRLTAIGTIKYAGTLYRYMDGILDEYGIWDRDLTNDEVSALYNSGNGLTY